MREKRKRTAAEGAADKRRSGRPPKRPEERQDERVMVRMTKAERKYLEELAKQRGLSLGALMMSPWRKEQ